jgi:hypothetical protein
MFESLILIDTILTIVIVPLSVAVITLAVLFTRFFRRTPFEKPWKILFIVPPLLLFIALMDPIGKAIGISGGVYYNLRLFALFLSMFAFLYSLYSFYQALVYVQPYPGAIIVRYENPNRSYKANPYQEGEKISVSRGIYERLKKLAEERGMTINQFVYGVVVPEWLEEREWKRYNSKA